VHREPLVRHIVPMLGAGNILQQRRGAAAMAFQGVSPLCCRRPLVGSLICCQQLLTTLPGRGRREGDGRRVPPRRPGALLRSPPT
jgi:hypothetical protein